MAFLRMFYPYSLCYMILSFKISKNRLGYFQMTSPDFDIKILYLRVLICNYLGFLQNHSINLNNIILTNLVVIVVIVIVVVINIVDNISSNGCCNNSSCHKGPHIET